MRIIVIIIVFVLNPASILHHPSCFLLFPSTPEYHGIAAHWITTAVVSVPNSGLYLVKIRSDLTEITAGEIFFQIGEVKANVPEGKTIQKV